MNTETRGGLDPRIANLKVAAGILAVAGCAAAVTVFGVAMDWLSLPMAWSPWIFPILMNTLIWGSTLGIVLGAGGRILAVKMGQPARFFAILTGITLVIYATTMFTMAYLFD